MHSTATTALSIDPQVTESGFESASQRALKASNAGIVFAFFPLFFSTVSEILFADERLDRRAASEQVVENEEELKIQGAKNPVVKCTF